MASFILLGLILLLVASVLISIVLSLITASFRPRRPLLWGNFAGMTGIALTVGVFYILVVQGGQALGLM